MNDHTDPRIDQLLATAKAQSDLLTALFTNTEVTAARLETILSMQRELFVTLGVAREKVKENCNTTFANCLAVAHKDMLQSLQTALGTDESSGDFPDNKGGHHLN